MKEVITEYQTMKTTRIYCSIILFTMGFYSAQAQYPADGLRLSQISSSVGARSQAMGNSVVGIADDYSALFGNPAGLSQQKSFEFSVGLSSIGYDNDVTFFGNNIKDNNNAIRLDNLGIVYPIPTRQGGLTFAFGFGRVANFTSVASFEGFNPSTSIVKTFKPYGGTQFGDFDLLTLSLDEADNLINNQLAFRIFLADTLDDYLFPVLTDSVQQSTRILEGGGINHWSFGGGIDIAKNLSIGVTLNFVSGTYTFDNEFTESDTRNIYKSTYRFPYNFDHWIYANTITSDLSGFNALFGIMYRQPGKYRIGATVRVPTTYEISQTFTEDGTSYFDDGFFEKLSPALIHESKYQIVTPLVVSGGLSAQPLDWIMIAGDAEYTDWTQIEFETDDQELKKEHRDFKKMLRETWNLRCGAEVSIWDIGLKLRAGLEYKPSPWKNKPSSYDQIKYTCGFGFIIGENSSINASYALGVWKTDRSNLYWINVPSFETSELVTTNTINVTFSHRF
jgi:long-subunit fatty acid transport protein